MRRIRIVAPWNVPISKKKKFHPNLNQYRNSHYQILNKAKHIYSELLEEQLKDIEPFNKVRVTLTAFPPTKRKFDNDNLAPHMKFFLDAIVQSGLLKDDHYEIVTETIHNVGNIDKDNPRVEFLIEEL